MRRERRTIEVRVSCCVSFVEELSPGGTSADAETHFAQRGHSDNARPPFLSITFSRQFDAGAAATYRRALARRLLRRRPRLTLACSLLLSLLCTLTVYVPLPLAGRFRAHLWRTFPCWLFYFVLGMALAASGWDKLTAFCEKHWTALLGIGLAAAFLYSLDSLRCGDPDSVKPQLFLYAPLCLAVLLAARRPFRQLPRGEAAAAFLAKHSMTVYFVHVFVLQVLRLVPAFQGSALGMLGLFAACLLLSCAAAVFLDALAARLRRIPFPRRAA